MRMLALAWLWVGCVGASAPAPPERGPGDWSERERAVLAGLRLDATPRPDLTNRWSDDPGAARLGQALFFDAGLSPSGEVSCATCHDPAHGFADPKPLSEGVGQTARHAPAIPGSQYGPWLYWDGRADSLWSQAAGPLEHPHEMASSRVYVVKHIQRQHADAYRTVFGDLPDFSDPARFPDLARPSTDDTGANAAWEGMSEADRRQVTRVFTHGLKAIAAYERLLVPTEAPFDRYVDAVLAGDPGGSGALTDAQVRGLTLFVREGNCVACHSGPMLTDRAFHNLGLPLVGKYDAGRTVGAAQVLGSEFSCRSGWSDATDCPELDYLDPEFPDFQQAFKTPTLRNVANTAPYMHHGQLADLSEVLTFYSELPGDPAANHRELTLEPLDLTEAQKADLIAFLLALTGEPLPSRLVEPPQSPDEAG